MEKRSSHLFSEPQRQSLVAIILIVYNLYKKLIRQFWPFLLLAIANVRSEKSFDKTLTFILIIAILSSVYSLWAFFKYYFYIEAGDLVVEKGIFQKTKTSIPIDRIQAVNFEQNIIHRIFDVVKLNIDTAGSASSELKLQALSKEKATKLRAYIFENKNTQERVEESEGQAYETKEEVITIGFGSLLKIGATENHVRSGFLIVFFGFWVFDQIKELGFESLLSRLELNWSGLLGSLVTLSVLIILFSVAAFAVSVVRVIFQYYDLKLFREIDGFKLSYGLLNRKQTTAKDHKIQTISWGQNWLQKKAGLYKIFLKQASSREVGSSKSIRIPGANIFEKEQVYTFLLGQKHVAENVSFKPIQKQYLWYHIRNLSLIFIPCLITVLNLGNALLFIFLLGLFVYLIINTFKEFKKTQYSINSEIIIIKGGSFGAKEIVLEPHKVQSVILKQSWYQRRRNLATVNITTAAENAAIPFVTLEEGSTIVDRLLYYVESSQEAWM